MKALLYTNKTPLGTFWIRPEPAGRVRLGIDRMELRAYPSPKAAARAVADRQTGWGPWDKASEVVAPRGLEAWRREAGHRTTRRLAAEKSGQQDDQDGAILPED
ncbi:MAG: hypothetical protein JWP08_3005 [Bryobacterales bacterium]|nr:hypothetical protein [Bryobacterales bacterium]